MLRHMKTFSALAILALSLITVIPAQAQSGMALANWSDIKVGAMFTAGAATNAGSVETGWKTSPAFSFSGGALAIIPLSANIAFDLGVCYASRAVGFHLESSTDVGVDYSLGYLSIEPGFNLGGFTIGLGIGLPMSASATLKNIPAIPGFTTAPPFTITTSDLNMLIEVRVGGSIPLMQSDKNELRLLIDGSYAFSGIIKSASLPTAAMWLSNRGEKGYGDTMNNGPLASLQIGVAYLFDTNPH